VRRPLSKNKARFFVSDLLELRVSRRRSVADGSTIVASTRDIPTEVIRAVTIGAGAIASGNVVVARLCPTPVVRSVP